MNMKQVNALHFDISDFENLQHAIIEVDTQLRNKNYLFKGRNHWDCARIYSGNKCIKIIWA